jgi:hypothetical protein
MFHGSIVCEAMPKQSPRIVSLIAAPVNSKQSWQKKSSIEDVQPNSYVAPNIVFYSNAVPADIR